MEPLLFSTGVVFRFIGQTTLGLTNFEICISVFHLCNQIGSSNLVGGRSYWAVKLFSAMYLEEILFSSSSRLTFWIVPLFSTHPIYHSTPDKEVWVSEWVSENDDEIFTGKLLLNVLIWWEPLYFEMSNLIKAHLSQTWEKTTVTVE